jgi:hypothetical protein
MDVQMLEMDPRIAAIHYKDYRKKVREARTARVTAMKAEITEGNKKRVNAYKNLSQLEKEDIVMMESYRAMAKGQRIINVANAIRGAALDLEKYLPVLAIARADWVNCHLRFDTSPPFNNVVFSESPWLNTNWRSNAAKRYIDPKKVIPFMSSIFGAELTNAEWRKGRNLPVANTQRAVVPTIPVHLRPAGDLSEYFILFEAEWDKHAPPDPLLLKHVGGHMYSVLAQWDLTDVEKAVLEGRFA